MGDFLALELRKGPENWFYRDFLSDKVLMANRKALTPKLREYGEKTYEQDMKAMEQDNAACYHFLMLAPLIVKPPSKE